MTDISPARTNLQEEETNFRSGITESYAKRLGGGVNFINLRQYQSKQFNINGPYASATGIGLDGMWPIIFDMEIIGIGFFNVGSGASGTTTFEMRRFTSSGVDAGSIFSVLPAISSAAPDNAYAIRDALNASDIGSVTGITFPRLAVTDLNLGDAIRFEFTATMTQAENCGVIIYYRPR